AAGDLLSRWAILPVPRGLPPARPDGAGALLRVRTPALAAATVTTCAIAAGLLGPRDGAAAILATGLAALGAATILNRTLGGVTGDGYGAAAKLAELAVYTTLTALWTS